MKHRAMILVPLLALFAASARAQDTVPRGSVFQPGEVLQYKVKWNFFRLGTVTLKAVRDTDCRTPEEIKLIMLVESNPDLSFIWIREFNECVIDTRTFEPRFFHARHRNGEVYTEIRHEVDKTAHRTFYRVADKVSGNVLTSDTLQGVERFVEGPSLFFFTRCFSHAFGVRTVPTLVGGQLSTTDLAFSGEKEVIDIGAVDNPVRVRKFVGEAHWQGGTEAGLGGVFCGWISDDDAAVPIRSEVKVLLGSIRLELESWTRPGWAPPSGTVVSNR